LRSDAWDPVTAKFMDILSAAKGDSIAQYSSEMYQTEWQHFAPPEPYVFKLDAPTEWKTIGDNPIQVEGRILSGCIDTIRHLIGTPFGDIHSFRDKFIPNEKIIWVLENSDMDAPDFYRSLLQFYHAGWFEHTSGIVFGRTDAGKAKEDFTYIEALERIAKLADVPVVYDADIGHVPPQMTFVNGAFAELKVADGKAVLTTKLI
jgi:muramoyltetrapeptide carboxypeptidase